MIVDGRLQDVADQLGYRDAHGFVDGAHIAPGALDFVWQDLAKKCNVDAAYFRSAVPLVAFADVANDNEVRETHRRLWNLGRVPVLIATTPENTLVVDCNAVPSDGETPVIASSSLADSRRVLQEFSRYSLESGLSARLNRAAQRHTRVDRYLLENLKRLRLALVRAGMNEGDIEPVLGRSIFIRYLEDRGILTPEHMAELGFLESFIETLRRGSDATLRLFSTLAEHFNGDVFSMRTAPQLDDGATPLLAEFFEGTDLETGQGSLWRYDFGIIPTQLISSIYEQLLVDTQQKDAAHYTPRHLVDLVLDEVLPWDAPVTAPGRILDPSCGSGIFLAESFRRLAYMRSVRGSGQATYEELRDLLTSTIFGTDVNPAAIGVSAFSLYLALLERVDPPTIWRSVRLPDLVGKNLVVADFFDAHPLAGQNYQTIIGNPPWINRLDEPARRYVAQAGRRVADNQTANAFMWRASDLLEPDGYLGFVLPAKWFLHNRQQTVIDARRGLYEELDLQVVVDLSPLRKTTFGSARNPAAIAIARKKGRHTVSDSIVHVSPRRTPLAQNIDGIVVSQHNIQMITKTDASDPRTWKVLLWGTKADLEIIQRLRRGYPSLARLVRERGWTTGTGYQAGGGRHEDSTHMIGMPIIEPGDVESLRVFVSRDADLFDLPTVHYRRNRDIYVGPRVLMRKGFDQFPRIAYADEDGVFTDSLYAVVGSQADAVDLKAITGILNSSVARYWLFMTSSSWGVEREQIFTHEYSSMPIPKLTPKERDLLAGIVDQAPRTRQPEKEWLASLDYVVFDLFDLSPIEREAIHDTLSIRHSEFADGARSAAFGQPSADELSRYNARLQEQLNAVGRTRWISSVSQRVAGFTVIRCRAVPDGNHDADVHPSAAEPSNRFALESLLATRDPAPTTSSAMIIQPSLIWVDGNDVYLVKPDERRCWLASSGTQDAAQVLGAILTAGAQAEVG